MSSWKYVNFEHDSKEKYPTLRRQLSGVLFQSRADLMTTDDLFGGFYPEVIQLWHCCYYFCCAGEGHFMYRIWLELCFSKRSVKDEMPYGAFVKKKYIRLPEQINAEPGVLCRVVALLQKKFRKCF